MSYRTQRYYLTDYIIEALFEMPETRGKLLVDFYVSTIIAAMVFLGELPGEWGLFGIVAINTGLSAYLIYVGKALREAEQGQRKIKEYEER